VLVVGDANEADSYLGECHIDLDNFQPEQGFEGTFPLSDMVSLGETGQHWFKHVESFFFQHQARTQLRLGPFACFQRSTHAHV